MTQDFSKQNQKTTQVPAAHMAPVEKVVFAAPKTQVVIAPLAPIVKALVAPELPPEPVVPAPEAEVFYEVLSDFQVRRGSSHYTLRKGKLLSPKGYDIEALKALGAPLKQV